MDFPESRFLFSKVVRAMPWDLLCDASEALSTVDKIGILIFDIILEIIRGFPSFLLVGGGAKIGKFDARAPGRPDSRVPIRNLTP